MTTGHFVDEGPGLSRGSSELPSRVTTITLLAHAQQQQQAPSKCHPSATQQPVCGRSTCDYSMIGINSNNTDITGNPTGRYASSARRPTHAHTNTLSHTHKPNVTLTITTQPDHRYPKQTRQPKDTPLILLHSKAHPLYRPHEAIRLYTAPPERLDVQQRGSPATILTVDKPRIARCCLE